MRRGLLEFYDWLAWGCVQRKGVLTKNDLKLRLTFAQEVHCKLSGNFWEDVGFYLDGAILNQKKEPF